MKHLPLVALALLGLVAATPSSYTPAPVARSITPVVAVHQPIFTPQTAARPAHFFDNATTQQCSLYGTNCRTQVCPLPQVSREQMRASGLECDARLRSPEEIRSKP